MQAVNYKPETFSPHLQTPINKHLKIDNTIIKNIIYKTCGQKL